MRFEIGQKLWTIGFTFTNSTYSTNHSFMTSDPSIDDISKVHFVLMNIIEHHKVPDELTNRLKYNGFVATDGDNLWNNQFPRAAYDGFSNDYNYLFMLAKLEESPNDEVMNKILTEHPFVSTYSLIHFMETINGGLLNSAGQTGAEEEDPELYSKVCAIADLVVSEFKKQTGYSLICYHKELNLNDKTVITRLWKIE